MTVVLSVASDGLIIVSVDSAERRDFGNYIEYESVGIQKAYGFDGVGCVATWGARDANNIYRFLLQNNIHKDHHSVHELADFVEEYLTTIYRPNEFLEEDIGYHVAGFDRNGKPRLFHIFWGFDRPKIPHQLKREYQRQDCSPPHGGRSYLYNGRNDLAEVVIQALLNEMNSDHDIRFNLNTHEGLVCLSDLVIRFAAELTKDVGPPFRFRLLSPDNKIEGITNKAIRPIEEGRIKNALIRLSGSSPAGVLRTSSSPVTSADSVSEFFTPSQCDRYNGPGTISIFRPPQEGEF